MVKVNKQKEHKQDLQRISRLPIHSVLKVRKGYEDEGGGRGQPLRLEPLLKS
jgi:hypothetical protein